MDNPLEPWLKAPGQLAAGYSLYLFSFREHELDAADLDEELQEPPYRQQAQAEEWQALGAAGSEYLPWLESHTVQSLRAEFEEALEDDWAYETPEDFAPVFSKLEALLRGNGLAMVAGGSMLFEGNHNDTELFVCVRPQP